MSTLVEIMSFRLKNEKMDLKSYQKFMLKIKDEYNIGYDLIVAELSANYLNELLNVY